MSTNWLKCIKYINARNVRSMKECLIINDGFIIKLKNSGYKYAYLYKRS